MTPRTGDFSAHQPVPGAKLGENHHGQEPDTVPRQCGRLRASFQNADPGCVHAPHLAVPHVMAPRAAIRALEHMWLVNNPCDSHDGRRAVLH